MGTKSASASAFGLVLVIVMGPSLLPDRLAAERYRDCFETVLPRLLEDMSSCDAGCGFSATELQRTVGRCQAVVEPNISGKVDWTWRADCMASSIAGWNVPYGDT
jgi:hypothetical protein